eukprot:2687929-Rhodomonas_salina.2
MEECIEDRELEGRGKGLLARRDIAGGERVMIEHAAASVVLENWKTKICHQCFRLAKDLRGCSTCRQVAWCSEECQAAAAAQHGDGSAGTECKALQTMDTTMLRDADVSLAKIFLLVLCRRAKPEATKSYDEFLHGLVSNEDAIPADRHSELSIVSEIVLDGLPPSATIDEEDLERFMCAEQCNSFGIWGDAGPCQGKLVGFGLFPRLCLFNHNCIPNVTVSQEVQNNQRKLTAHALRAIPQGEELCISYSDASLLDNTEKRKAWLKKHYLFSCNCSLCQAEGAEAKEMIRSFNQKFR